MPVQHLVIFVDDWIKGLLRVDESREHHITLIFEELISLAVGDAMIDLRTRPPST